MIGLELRKLFRQQRLSNCFLILLLLMIGSLEISIYGQHQHQTQNVDNFKEYLTAYQATTPINTAKDLEQLQLRKFANNALVKDDAQQAQAIAYKAMNSRRPWLNYSGDILMTNLRAGEVEATREELQYLKQHQLTANMPLTILTNPKTATTNSISNDGLTYFANLSKRYYTKGLDQIWFWAKIGGIFIALAVLNLFLGDILSGEWANRTNHLAWLNLNGVKTSRIMMTKFLIHFFSAISLLIITTIVFLIYAMFRTGLGNLAYPVQNWQLGSMVKTPYFWLTANEDANYFAPFQIVFKPLSGYLAQFLLFIIALCLLNSALTIFINYLIKNGLITLIIMTLLPLGYFILPTGKTPLQFLNFDWLATGYLNYFNRTTSNLFNQVMLIMMLCAMILLAIPLCWCLRKEGKSNA